MPNPTAKPGTSVPVAAVAAAQPTVKPAAATTDNPRIGLSEDALARALEAEDNPPTDEPAAETENNANAGDESPSADSEISDLRSEIPEEEAIADDLSQAAAEEAGTETEDRGQESEDSEAEDRIAAIPKLTPEQKQHVSEIVRDRIAKVTAKVTEAEAKSAELETQKAQLEARVKELETSGPPSTTPAGPGPLGDIMDIPTLQKKANLTKATADFCADQLLELDLDPEGVEARLKGMKVTLTDRDGNEDYSAPNIRKFLATQKRNAERTLEGAIPERAKWLNQERAISAEAEKLMPWLKDAKNPKTIKFNELVAAAPQAKAIFPSWKYVLALAAAQAIQIDEEAKGKVQKPPVKVPPKPVVRPATGARPQGPPPKQGSAEAAHAAALKKFSKTGSLADLEAAIAAEG